MNRSAFWLRNLVIPAVVLSAYCLLFAHYVSALRQLPDGVNLAFTQALWPAMLGLAGIALMAYLLTLTSTRSLPSSGVSANKLDWLLLLLPLAPIVQYLLKNHEILSLGDVVYLLGLFLVCSAMVVLLIPAILQQWASLPVLRISGLIFAFMLTNMPALSASFRWFSEGDLKIQLAIALALFTLAFWLYRSKHRALLYLLIAAYFISNSLANWAGPTTAGTDSLPLTQHPLLQAVADEPPAQTPNIYLLVYDSYVANETMLQYDIDNGAQEEYLIQQGFKLYPNTYSIGGHSVASISTVLNASTDFYGNSRSGASGNGIVHEALQKLGYHTYGIFPSDFFFQGINSGYDVTFPESKPVAQVLLDGILVGEFRFDIGFDSRTGVGFLQRKRQLFEENPLSPLFHYSHSYLPGHSQNSGSCLPNEKELYAESLELANQEMRMDLDALLQSDPEAIIVIAGDHGPYLSKNCFSTSEGGYNLREITRYDIQDRFGTFLAIRWPTQGYEQYDQIVVLQDLFPTIFAYLYQDSSILQARIPPVILYEPSLVSGAYVEDGIIRGGVNDGEPLFISD
ncbi:MAG: hypothetical protein KIS80_01320 [Anaerolineales bacterium]|nr:hypothetical protein [Anaerolineales bacterium]